MKTILRILNPEFGKKWFGFPIEIDWSFSALLMLVAFSSTFSVFMFIVSVYFSILLHEFGHVIVAKKFGYVTHKIRIFMFGGAASIDFDEFKIKPLPEFLIAIAGPLVNFIIWLAIIIFYVLYYSFDEAKYILNHQRPIDTFFFDFATAQLLIIIFNMLPIYPMDGGRVLRSITTAITKNVFKSNKIVSIVAIIGAVIAIFYYSYLHFNLNVLIIMPLIILVNYFQLKDVFKKEKLFKNLPKDIIIIFRRRAISEEYFVSVFKRNTEFPNNYMELIDINRHTIFNERFSMFDDVAEILQKFKKLGYVYTDIATFEDVVPHDIVCYNYKLE